MTCRNDGEKYIKNFDGYTHLLTMLFAVIMRFDSFSEIEIAIWSGQVPIRSTLSAANARCLRLTIMVRMVLVYYLNLYTFFNQSDADMKNMLAEVSESPPQQTKKNKACAR